MLKSYHVPVMMEEVIHGLNIQSEGIYVDCTFGGGGHSKAILERLGSKGKLIVFDQDEDVANNIFKDDRIIFIPNNFRHLKRFLRLHKIEKINGLLADLGISSHQLDQPSRGFSTRFDAPLDMRMDRKNSFTAADVLKTYSMEKLHRIFEKYGEVTNAKTLAATIIKGRENREIVTINNFKEVIYQIVKGNPNKYLAQVFQALRIEVNDEMHALEELLRQLPDVLATNGRVVIISFHSIEDRIVKNFFRTGSFDKIEVDVFGNSSTSPFKLITKKPITARIHETNINPRSRSAKVRIAEKY